MRLPVIALSLCLLLFSAGCERRRQSEPPDQFSVANAAPETSNQVISGRYVVNFEGEVTVAFAEVIDLQVMRVTSSDPEFAGLRLLSVGPQDRVPTGQGAYFRVAFDLLSFTGDGNYQIRAGSPRDLLQFATPQPGAPPPQLDQSNVLIQYWPSEEITPFRIFDVALEPCSLEVSRGGLSGVLRCSGVAEESGAVLNGVVMSWDAN